LSKRYRMGIIISLILLAMFLMVGYSNIKPSATQEDISVEATLQINDTANNTYDEYLVDISIIKKRDSQVVIYPYVEGLGAMTFNSDEKEEYFRPGAIGSDGVTEPIAITELKNSNLIDEGNDVSLIGFWFPDEEGQYKARIYLDKFDDFKEIKNPALVCVYIEEKYGKKLTWSKVVPVTFTTGRADHSESAKSTINEIVESYYKRFEPTNKGELKILAQRPLDDKVLVLAEKYSGDGHSSTELFLINEEKRIEKRATGLTPISMCFTANLLEYENNVIVFGSFNNTKWEMETDTKKPIDISSVALSYVPLLSMNKPV